MIGTSAAIRTVLEEMEYAARSESRVLIRGERGAGKATIARAIHDQSCRRDQPFVVLDCTDGSDRCLDPMRVRMASAGTAYIDDVAVGGPSTQAALMRLLEGGVVDVQSPPGAAADVRLITATSRNLLRDVADGSFRSDLYYRLNVILIVVPPLRDRREDIPLLVDHFLRALASERGMAVPKLDDGALERLTRYEWPGNICELKSVMKQLVLRPDACLIGADALAPELRPLPT